MKRILAILIMSASSAFAVNFGDITAGTNINTLSDSILNISSNGLVKRTGANTYVFDASTYLTANQSISLTGDVTGTGATSITTTYNNIVPITKGGTGSNITAGSGKILQSGASVIALTPYTLPTSVPTTGKVVISDGTNLVGSTPTYPNAAGTAGYQLTSDGTNVISKASDLVNGSSAQQTGFSSNTYLAGSLITIAAGDVSVGSVLHCVFDMSKTTAGTGAPIISIHMGVNGNATDAAVQTITFAAATGVGDTGVFEVWVNFRAVGASATVASVGECRHNLAATGLTSTGAAGVGVISNSTSSTFNSTTVTKIGIGFNGGASYVGTCNSVQTTFNKL